MFSLSASRTQLHGTRVPLPFWYSLVVKFRDKFFPDKFRGDGGVHVCYGLVKLV